MHILGIFKLNDRSFLVVFDLNLRFSRLLGIHPTEESFVKVWDIKRILSQAERSPLIVKLKKRKEM